MMEKDITVKYCPLAQGSCKGSLCVSWKKGEGESGDCIILMYFDLLTTPSISIREP